MADDCINPVYFPSSFKGVPFEAVSSADDFGRRGVEYEYPTAEHVNYTDLGRKIRKYKLEGRIVSGLHGPLSNAMVAAVESPGPGILLHPIFGPVQVSCSTLTVGVEYIDKKRYTKLEFEFIEAPTSAGGPLSIGGVLSDVMNAGLGAVGASILSATWGVAGVLGAVGSIAGVVGAIGGIAGAIGGIAGVVGAVTGITGIVGAAASVLGVVNAVAGVAGLATSIISTGMAVSALAISTSLAVRAFVGDDEEGFDIVDVLNRGATNPTAYKTFRGTVDPIIMGTAYIRMNNMDALSVLRQFNTTVVDQVAANPEIESLGVTARLALVNDFALVSAQYTYQTIAQTVQDLDFVMMVYDEEEAVAASKGDDVLVRAISVARAKASAAILQNNIQLPGLVTYDVNGRWPSLVAAQIIYQDGERAGELENNNPKASPFFLPRNVVGYSR